MSSDGEQRRSVLEIFLVFLRLGTTSFGGPVAHIGYFREAFVERKRWLTDTAYADLVALCQFLPGPASSQVGMAIGFREAGVRGLFAAWLGFTAPSALLLAAFALGIGAGWQDVTPGAMVGLKLAAAAVVVQAVWGMARSLCPDAPRQTVLVLGATVAILLPGTLGQLSVIVGAGLFGLIALRHLPSVTAPSQEQESDVAAGTGSHVGAILCLAGFFALLFGLPLIANGSSNPELQAFSDFYRAGALVFGGGHVVLPLLQADLVPTGQVPPDVFLAGYGAAQAVPGPLFTFATYLGAVMGLPSGTILGALICTLGIFVPSFLLVAGVLPFWGQLRQLRALRAALAGVNAGVVGLLLAALYTPIWTSAILGAAEFVAVLVAVAALMIWRVPVPLVVFGCALAGFVMSNNIWTTG